MSKQDEKLPLPISRDEVITTLKAYYNDYLLFQPTHYDDAIEIKRRLEAKDEMDKSNYNIDDNKILDLVYALYLRIDNEASIKLFAALGALLAKSLDVQSQFTKYNRTRHESIKELGPSIYIEQKRQIMDINGKNKENYKPLAIKHENIGKSYYDPISEAYHNLRR